MYRILKLSKEPKCLQYYKICFKCNKPSHIQTYCPQSSPSDRSSYLARGGDGTGNRNLEAFTIQLMKSSIDENCESPVLAGKVAKLIKWFWIVARRTIQFVKNIIFQVCYVKIASTYQIRWCRYVNSNFIGIALVNFKICDENVFYNIINVCLVEEISCNLLSVSTINKANYKITLLMV